MDTSPEYVLMCKKAKEIQKQKPSIYGFSKLKEDHA